MTKDVVDNLSKEKALATIASHITAQIGTNNRKTSQFNDSLKTTGIVLMKASNYQTIQLSNLESKLRLFRRDANRKVDAVRRSAEVYVKKTIKYLRLAQSYSSSSEEIQSLYAPLDQLAAFAKDEAIRLAQRALQESLNYVKNYIRKLYQKMKHFEEAIEGAL